MRIRMPTSPLTSPATRFTAAASPLMTARYTDVPGICRSSANPAVAFSSSEYLYTVSASTAPRTSLATSDLVADDDEDVVVLVVCFPEARAPYSADEDTSMTTFP